MSDGMLRASAVFQSTLSMRRATVEKGCFGFYEVFQSTLSMRRATWREHPNWVLSIIFQSTLSMRRAT